MEKVYKKYLFNKHILVSEKTEKYVFETLFAMANMFGIRITEGQKLATSDMIEFAAGELGIDVPQPFYRGFPDSVRKLTPDQLLFDQLVHYTVTYGYGYFDVPGHSLFETDIGRKVFKENTEIKDFIIISEKDALEKITQLVDSLFATSRPLNLLEFDLVSTYCKDFGYVPEKIASKNTAVKLLIKTRNPEFSRFLQLSDVIKLLDELSYERYSNENLKKLNLRNQDRKLITGVINSLFERGNCNVRECYEKKAVWNGLLHHIHYKPVNEMAKFFVTIIRGRKNYSDYSEFEKALAQKDVVGAAQILKKNKGNGALLRRIVHLLKKCETVEDMDRVLDLLEPGNFTILLQLYLKYASNNAGPLYASYAFTKHGTMRYHYIDETENYKAYFNEFFETNKLRFINKLYDLMKETVKNRLGKVYIDPAMKAHAMPLASSVSSGGFGVLSTGTRVKIKDTKKIRCFIYWEKVNDIDLSAIGVDDNSNIYEFSWRTMFGEQSEAITFSGDQTSGYNGGSEYFDIVIDKYIQRYPRYRYLVFCANVYSFGQTFADCVCRAGYMTRDIEDSGEVYEPKTVETAFTINCASNFGYLFAYDTKYNEIIWINQSQGVNRIVAAEGKADFLVKYFDTVDVFNVYNFFEMAASEVVSDIKDADVIVSDNVQAVTADNIAPDDAQTVKEIIHSYDFERIKALMN